MGRFWPALDVPEPDDLLFATLDEFAPTAVEDGESVLRVFFSDHGNRDAARARLTLDGRAAIAIDVDDGDWARRSQQNLRPVTVGRITVVPEIDGVAPDASAGKKQAANSQPLTIVIEPSMGFGTGHHATTRLCLAALQRTDLTGAFVLDAGTGSGILAIAAARLGATAVLGVDVDYDAIHSAIGNLALNPVAKGIRFAFADLTAIPLPRADVITANLTGALLTRLAGTLLDALTPGGILVLSGILAAEEQGVRRAFPTTRTVWRQQDEEWIGLMLSPSLAVKRA